jgi:hypothetical protein
MKAAFSGGATLPVLGNGAVFNIAPVNISWWKMQ